MGAFVGSVCIMNPFEKMHLPNKFAIKFHP